MYLVDITYIKPLAEVDSLITAHVDYLNKYYDAGVFLLSGRKEPRTGGLIWVEADSRSRVDSIVAEDPFFIHKIAQYSITEFFPTKSCAALDQLVK